MAAEEAADTQLMLGVGLIGEDASASPQARTAVPPPPPPGPGAAPAPGVLGAARGVEGAAPSMLGLGWGVAGPSFLRASACGPAWGPPGPGGGAEGPPRASQGLPGPGEEFLPNRLGCRRTQTWRVTELSRLGGGRCAGNRAGPRAARGPHSRRGGGRAEVPQRVGETGRTALAAPCCADVVIKWF